MPEFWATEHHFVLKRGGGPKAVIHMMKFLDVHFKDSEVAFTVFSFRAPKTKGIVEKFKFKLEHQNGTTYTVQSKGFYTFEIYWKSDAQGHIYDLWCRFDEGNKKPLVFQGDEVSTKNISIKYTSI